MKVVTVAAAKGGTGKTTVTAALAVRAAAESTRVAMFDLNADQGDLTNWWVLRGEPMWPRVVDVENISRDVEVLRKEAFDWLFIDCPPVELDIIEAAIVKSDAVVIPVRPIRLRDAGDGEGAGRCSSAMCDPGAVRLPLPSGCVVVSCDKAERRNPHTGAPPHCAPSFPEALPLLAVLLAHRVGDQRGAVEHLRLPGGLRRPSLEAARFAQALRCRAWAGRAGRLMRQVAERGNERVRDLRPDACHVGLRLPITGPSPAQLGEEVIDQDLELDHRRTAVVAIGEDRLLRHWRRAQKSRRRRSAGAASDAHRSGAPRQAGQHRVLRLPLRLIPHQPVWPEARGPRVGHASLSLGEDLARAKPHQQVMQLRPYAGALGGVRHRRGMGWMWKRPEGWKPSGRTNQQ